MLAFPRIKRDAVETSVKSSNVLDKEPLINSLAVLDTVTGSNVILALAVIGGVPKTPVAAKVKESRVMLAFPRIKRDAVETTVTGSKAMLALAAMDTLLVLDTVKGSKVIDASPRIKRDAVETSVKESRVMLALPVIPLAPVVAIRGNLTRSIISHQLKAGGCGRDGWREGWHQGPTSTQGILQWSCVPARLAQKA